MGLSDVRIGKGLEGAAPSGKMKLLPFTTPENQLSGRFSVCCGGGEAQNTHNHLILDSAKKVNNDVFIMEVFLFVVIGYVFWCSVAVWVVVCLFVFLNYWIFKKFKPLILPNELRGRHYV